MKYDRKLLEKAVEIYPKGKGRKFVLASELSDKQLSNAIKHIDKYIKPEDVVAFLDSTLFANGKEGVLITLEKVASSDSATSAAYFENFVKAEATANELAVYYAENTRRRIKIKTYAIETAALLNTIVKLRDENATAAPEKEKEAPKPQPQKPAAAATTAEPAKKEEPAKEQRDYGKMLLSVYEMQAKMGDVSAQTECANMYYFGKEIPVDKEKAFYWFEKAANNGSYSSAFNLAVMYNIGEGTKEDKKAAFEWFKKSALGGYALGQFVLGKAYFYDLGLAEKDYNKAYFWLDKAANQHHEEAIKLLEEVKTILEKEKAKNKPEVFVIPDYAGEKLYQYAKKLEKEGRIKDAFECYKKAADERHYPSMLEVAEMILEQKAGLGMEKQAVDYLDDIIAGRFWSVSDDVYFKAKEIEQNHEEVVGEIRRIKKAENTYKEALEDLEKGSFIEASEKFRISASAGKAEAMYQLGILYESGKLSGRRIDEAIFWLKKAEEKHFHKGGKLLLDLIAEKEGFEEEQDSAKKDNKSYYFPKAFDGEVDAMLKMAAICEEEGKEEDEEEDSSEKLIEAFYWNLRAAESGNEVAAKEVGRFFEEGLGVPKNLEKALDWYERAPSAAYDCERVEMEMDDYVSDESELEDFIEWAGDYGEIVFEGGMDFEEKFTGYALIYISAAMDYPEAQLMLGKIYREDSPFGKADFEKSDFWIMEACKKGNDEAIDYAWKNNVILN